MHRGALYLAIHDVSKDRERGRVATLLEGYGTRLQKSAFQLRLTRASKGRLLLALEHLQLSSGWAGLYRLSDSARADTIGARPADALEESRHAYVV